jgi:hypothetical protein
VRRKGTAGAESAGGDDAAPAPGGAPVGDDATGGDQGSCLLRGVEQVRTELSVTVWAYTLRRVLHLGGVPPLMAPLGSVWRRECSGLTGKDGMKTKRGAEAGREPERTVREGFDTVWRCT